MSKSKSIYVEFIGPAGVGKSTLYKEVLSRVEKRLGECKVVKNEDIKSSFVYLIKNPTYTTKAIFYSTIISFHKIEKRMKSFRKLMKRSVSLNNKLYKNIVFLDEGPVNKILTEINRSRNERMSKYYYNYLELVFLKNNKNLFFVFLDASPETIARRILARSKKGLGIEKKSYNEIIATYKNAKRKDNKKGLQKFLKKYNAQCVDLINEEGCIEGNATKIINILKINELI